MTVQPASAQSASAQSSSAQSSSAQPDPVAATVVLLRDTGRGPEVLLLERPDRGSFAGAWVFPGGAVDPDDERQAGGSVEEEASARVAAVRETREETGLLLAGADLTPISCWVPPQGIAKRMRTWFFLGSAPEGAVALSPDESVDHAWLRPVDALERHTDGSLLLFPPTWVTLHGLRDVESVADAVDRVKSVGVQRFSSRFAEDRRTIYWEGDVAYPGDELSSSAGRRHRLEMSELPWVYSRD